MNTLMHECALWAGNIVRIQNATAHLLKAEKFVQLAAKQIAENAEALRNFTRMLAFREDKKEEENRAGEGRAAQHIKNWHEALEISGTVSQQSFLDEAIDELNWTASYF